jgi:NitT/TauT family transport system ATP-binding protein
MTSTTDQQYIVVDDVAHSYGELKAIEHVSFAVARGGFASIIGPSGCGKSTLLTILSGLMRPTEGRVLVDGRDMFGPRNDAIRVGYIFQEPRVLPWKTVRDNLLFALTPSGIPKNEWDDRIEHYLQLVGLQDFKHAWPLTLSGGMRQRVSIARALVIDPTFILMDEPYSSLDEMTARVAREELLHLWQETHKTIIFVTHSIGEAVFMSDHIYFMTRRPGTVFRRLDVGVPRPRDYDSLELARIESDAVKDALDQWGYRGREQLPAAESVRAREEPGTDVALPRAGGI